MGIPYIAKQQTYLTDGGKRTRTCYHPAIKLAGETSYCYFPDESTESGLIEYDNQEDALINAINLYKHYENEHLLQERKTITKDVAAEIRCDKSLWEKKNLDGVGNVLLVEESYYDWIVQEVEQLQEDRAHWKMKSGKANKEIEVNNIVRFQDGKFLGMFGKVEKLSQAIMFNGDWETQIHMKNNPIRLSEEVYEVKTVQIEKWIIN